MGQTMTDQLRWHNVLKSMFPTIDEDMKILESGPKYRAVISRRSNKWCVEIIEDWFGDTDQLNDVIDWTVNQLAGWENCTRMSFDMWYFKYKKDAEKFTTLFHLKWPT